MNPISKLAIATGVALLVCHSIFLISSKGLSEFNIHKTERLSEIFLNKTPYDIIFTGSSRTHTTINPAIIDSVCSLNSYNAGAEGGNLYEFQLTLDGYLLNHAPPKYLVITLDLHSFDIKRKMYNYTQYFPYVNNQVVKEKLQDNGQNAVFFQALPFLQLTAYDDYTRSNILKGLFGKNEIPAGDFQYKGYLSNSTNKLDSSSKTLVSPTNKGVISDEGMSYLQSIINTCHKKNIKLIFTYAPEYQQNLQNTFLNKNDLFSAITQLANNNNIPFLRHDKLLLCQDPSLFANAGHVNKIGADVYSKILGEELNALIRTKTEGRQL